MKKTLLTSALATTIAAGGALGLSDHQAHAAEQDHGVGQTALAQKAQTGDTSLNKPLHAGEYDYKFNVNGFDYHFWSDGVHAGYEFHEGHQYTSGVPSQVQNNTQVQDTVKQQMPQKQQTSTSQQSYTQAPQKMEQPKQTTSHNQPTQSTSSKGSSAGTPAGMEAIVQRESGGDPTAVNPSSGAAGKYQFLQSTWDSVAPSQYQGVSPAEVPEHVQDQVAAKVWNGGAGSSHWSETV